MFRVGGSAIIPSRSNISNNPIPGSLIAMLCARQILTVLATVRMNINASNAACASHVVAIPVYTRLADCQPTTKNEDLRMSLFRGGRGGDE